MYLLARDVMIALEIVQVFFAINVEEEDHNTLKQ